MLKYALLTKYAKKKKKTMSNQTLCTVGKLWSNSKSKIHMCICINFRPFIRFLNIKTTPKSTKQYLNKSVTFFYYFYFFYLIYIYFSSFCCSVIIHIAHIKKIIRKKENLYIFDR